MKEVSVDTSARQLEMFISKVPPTFCIWDHSEKYAAPYYCKTLLKVEEKDGASTSKEVCFHISKLCQKYMESVSSNFPLKYKRCLY
jgi:hypothetical protein